MVVLVEFGNSPVVQYSRPATCSTMLLEYKIRGKLYGAAQIKSYDF